MLNKNFTLKNVRC